MKNFIREKIIFTKRWYGDPIRFVISVIVSAIILQYVTSALGLTDLKSLRDIAINFSASAGFWGMMYIHEAYRNYHGDKKMDEFQRSIESLNSKLGMKAEPNRPRVGVGVLICRDGKVLLGTRLAAHGKGTWSPPGGKMEFGETPMECAQREILEETNLHLTHMRVGPYTNDVFASDNLHYITLCIIAEATGEPKAMEPEKCAEWKWFAWNELPSPLFLPLENLKKQGFNPFVNL